MLDKTVTLKRKSLGLAELLTPYFPIFFQMRSVYLKSTVLKGKK